MWNTGERFLHLRDLWVISSVQHHKMCRSHKPLPCLLPSPHDIPEPTGTHPEPTLFTMEVHPQCAISQSPDTLGLQKSHPGLSCQTLSGHRPIIVILVPYDQKQVWPEASENVDQKNLQGLVGSEALCGFDLLSRVEYNKSPLA
jgi:hypothetical protein